MFAQTCQSSTAKNTNTENNHLKAFSLAVEGPAVLVPVLVGLSSVPVFKVPGRAGHPDPAPLVVTGYSIITPDVVLPRGACLWPPSTSCSACLRR